MDCGAILRENGGIRCSLGEKVLLTAEFRGNCGGVILFMGGWCVYFLKNITGNILAAKITVRYAVFWLRHSFFTLFDAACSSAKGALKALFFNTFDVSCPSFIESNALRGRSFSKVKRHRGQEVSAKVSKSRGQKCLFLALLRKKLKNLLKKHLQKRRFRLE